MSTNTQNGITGSYDGANVIIVRAITAFTAIAWYNSIELLILVLAVFKKYKGLYFWSLLITSFSIIPYQLGAWMRQVGISTDSMLCDVISTVGWTFMVSGQSIVLYSRLHLVTQDQRLLRIVLAMIIIDAVLMWIPTTVLSLGSQTSKKDLFIHGYEVMEKIQMTIWSIQEIIVSGIYLWEVRRILQYLVEGGTRKILYELIIINVVIIGLDVALLSVEYVNLYQLEVTLKGMVYSIKLKLEFGVLSKLVRIVTNNGEAHRVTSNDHELGPDRSSSSQTASSTMMKFSNVNAPEHIEYIGFDSAGPENWSNAPDAPGLQVPLSDLKHSRQPSITDMYPGRLG